MTTPCEKVKPDLRITPVVSSQRLWACNDYNLQPGTKVITDLYGLDSVTARFLANRGTGRTGIEVRDKASGFNNLYVSKVAWSNDGNWDICDVEYKGFISNSMDSKHPTGAVTQGTTEAPIQGHPNYRSATAWNGEFAKLGLGEGGNPNKYGRVLDADSGEFVKFGPLPDGKDGRPAARGRCDDRQTGPWCQLQGITSYITPGQVTYKYSILTRKSTWWQNYHLYLGTISNPNSSLIPVPVLPKVQNYESDFLFSGFNVSTEKLGNTDDSRFFKLDFGV